MDHNYVSILHTDTYLDSFQISHSRDTLRNRGVFCSTSPID